MNKKEMIQQVKSYITRYRIDELDQSYEETKLDMIIELEDILKSAGIEATILDINYLAK